MKWTAFILKEWRFEVLLRMLWINFKPSGSIQQMDTRYSPDMRICILPKGILSHIQWKNSQ